MSDTEPRTPGRDAATGAAWTETEKACLGTIQEASASPRRQEFNACRKIIKKLKDKLKNDIENIKAGLPVAAAVTGGGATSTPTKATPRKRKIQGDEEGENTPKKRAVPHKKKNIVIVKDEKEVDEEV
ncbi:hypothetical protein N0V94_004097 [Neodidymelliopsis sp. IMI 364377]|nr:hypothetical protein N0V94_004097 [Neodidymelliopsis sp. IMI 364377]